jgi:hypothetical protein
MKHLKIYLAVFILSFLTASECKLMAQTKSTLVVGESLSMNDFANGLTSENGKYRFSTNTKVLTITNTENNKQAELPNTNSGAKFITEIKVTEGVVTIMTIEIKDPVNAPNDMGPKEVLAKWGDETKGTKNTKLVMQDDGHLILYAGNAQGGKGDVLWDSGIPYNIR